MLRYRACPIAATTHAIIVFGLVAMMPFFTTAATPLKLPLLNAQNLSYGITIRVGAKRQKFTVMVDTGSQFLWIPSYNATGGGRVTNTSSFNPQSSSSFVSLGLRPFQTSYGSGNFEGVAGVDTVCLGGDLGDSSCASNITFALGTKFSAAVQGPFDGILGLKAKSDLHRLPVGLALEEPSMLHEVLHGDRDFDVKCSPTGGSGGALVVRNTTNSNQNEDDAVTIPTNTSNDPFDWLIDATFHSISVDSSGIAAEAKRSWTSILDVGTSFNYLPNDVANRINAQLGCTVDASSGLCVFASCPSYNTTAAAHLHIAATSVSGSLVDLSMRGLENVVWMCHPLDSSYSSRKEQACQCASAHVAGGRHPFWVTLGAPFFRVFDVKFHYSNTRPSVSVQRV